jgi:putative methyltransferase
LAILLTHDLLLKNGVAAPKTNALAAAVSRHKTRLSAEFTRLRLRLGFHSVAKFREAIESGQLADKTASALPQAHPASVPHPRWIRINSIKSSVTDQMATTFKDFSESISLAEVASAAGNQKLFYRDVNIPDLIALPPKADLSKSDAYRKGEIIFQDKASCFPAYLLNITTATGDILDACAAPGNKTTHLAAFSLQHPSNASSRRSIKAYERDRARSGTLRKMVSLAGAENHVRVVHGDFLSTKQDDAMWQNLSAILLDPSCSGSGIVGRDDEHELHLPEISQIAAESNPRKRKRPKTAVQEEAPAEAENEEMVAQEDNLARRLESLSRFQLKMIQHAMGFPNVTRLVYSTCSIHHEENEDVVAAALGSDIAKSQGWKLIPRIAQVEGLRKWETRGDLKVSQQLIESGYTLGGFEASTFAEACIRCEKGTHSGTMGFFVAGFCRDEVMAEADSEWNGCSDTD